MPVGHQTQLNRNNNDFSVSLTAQRVILSMQAKQSTAAINRRLPDRTWARHEVYQPICWSVATPVNHMAARRSWDANVGGADRRERARIRGEVKTHHNISLESLRFAPPLHWQAHSFANDKCTAWNTCTFKYSCDPFIADAISNSKALTVLGKKTTSLAAQFVSEQPSSTTFHLPSDVQSSRSTGSGTFNRHYDATECGGKHQHTRLL